MTSSKFDWTEVLDAVAHEDELLRLPAPDQLFARVMAEWDRAPRVAVRRRLRWWNYSGLCAASVALVFVGQILVRSGKTAPPQLIPLIGEPLVAGEEVRVIRMQVRRSSLGSFGIVDAQDPEGLVAVEILVGEDGVARALRVPPRHD